MNNDLGEAERQFVLIVVHLAKRLELEGHELMINFLFDMAKMISATEKRVAV